MTNTTFPSVFSLQGQVALITGGGTGIGLAIAQSMHAAGARVVLVGRREAELQAATRALGERASYVVHDITQLDAAQSLVDRVTKEVGPITCLVNNAGIHLKKPAIETTPEEFQKVLTTHVLGAHALVRAVAPGMIERKTGSILFTASMASLFGIPLVVAYSAAKTAHLGMVRTLATELSQHGIRVNAIAPGWIETEMSAKAMAGDPARKQKILGRTPMAKFGAPSDVGWAAVYLASPAGGFVTGVVLPIDGGASIGF
ncbi:MAG TPA: glucose 1-dehydrogenase [Opitutaceae bacterium]|jgi:gluconate 5-dehydrogenase|nr:MAG: Gluconate 5-dehydrogenase [Verrucomicrobia bacterium ADurb.Bin122]HOG92194.1 glucose 1-dehydrogenase [Opitutaceae bacterium]HOY55173.1 glucose 1-dehydrogenase [Opitutaceae bacterium]HPG16313.1 glucose 1-dehydrogenase [Opitutaceae bacterium]HPN99924.1 glucose 1-dehydrogenase [Opitutaceae bacterium]